VDYYVKRKEYLDYSLYAKFKGLFRGFGE